MKKLLTLLFTLAIAFSLTMPVFAQEAGGESAPQATKKEKKMKKEKKAKKEKKEKKEKKTEGSTQ